MCHQIDKKVIGPAWRDVAIRYRDDPTAETRLIAKVIEGGKGNWTEITGGAVMPPYGTRVAPGDIATLVTYVLSLK
jgi:cytochrome c